MNYITQLLATDNVLGSLITFLLLLFAVKEGIEILKYFCKLFGIKFKTDLEKEEIYKRMDNLEECNKQKGQKIDELIVYQKRSLEASKIQTRNSIIMICEDALANEEIEFYELQSLEDMYQMYVETLGGNSYASTMVQKVRLLPVVKKHEEQEVK